MKKPILLTTLSLILTLGITGIVNAAINPGNQQAVNTIPNNNAVTSTVKNTDHNPNVPVSPTDPASNQTLNQQATAQRPSVDQPEVTAPEQEYMYGQMGGTNMPMGLQQGSNMIVNEQGVQQHANQVNPYNGNVRGMMGSYTRPMSGYSMGHMGR